MIKVKYLCFYRFESQTTSNKFFVEAESLGDVKDGFWIDGYMKLTKASDCVYWIPPSAILYVEKRFAL